MTSLDERPHVLVVDDDAEVRDLLAAYLVQHGLEVTVAADAEAARRVLAAGTVRLAVLDVRMPGEDGLSLARFIRERLGIGVVMLTAAGEPVDRILGLEIGADDYLTKPFHPRELLTRVRGVLRRAGPPPAPAPPAPPPGEVAMGRCRFDPASHALRGPDGALLPLTPRELALLLAFVRHAGQSLPRQRLLELAGGGGSARSIDVQVARLRRKIERDPTRPRAFRTLRGGGYMFQPEAGQARPAAPVSPIADVVLRAVVDAALDCVILMDEDGVLREFNPAAERSFGHAREAVIGRPLGDVIVPPKLRQDHAAGLARLLATGESRMVGRRIETEGLRADGSLFPIELAIVELRLEGRRLFAAYLRDLTEARRAEAEIRRQREALHQSEKMAALGSLLAGVAHELNNPLSVVVGRALMIEEAVLQPAVANSARRLRAAAERCARIVRTFLAMARQSDGTRQPVSLPRLIDAALELLGYRLETAGIVVERQQDDGSPTIWGDPDRLHQVILNLLVNAQQALADAPTPRRLWVSVEAAGPEVRLVVADSGPGIPPELRRRVFDPFFTTKPTGAGTGIGLSFCQGIVAGMGGGIAVDERPGGGARFTVTLPTGAGETAPPERPAAGEPAPAAARILVVDDEAEIALMLQEALERDGHRVVTAGNGREARVLLAADRFDLVLSDIRMAEIDGPDLYRAICLDHPELADRFLVMTGDTLGSALQRLPPAMREQRIEKPIDLAALRRLMAERLAGAGPPAERSGTGRR